MIVPHEELSNTNKRLSSELYEKEIKELKDKLTWHAKRLRRLEWAEKRINEFKRV